MESTLYNGIPLASPWPPRRERAAMEPMRVPYLERRPVSPVQIDVGRQLFVDDFLIENTTMTRRWHNAKVHPASPVLVPDQPWEGLGEWKDKRARHAMPFSDGVWFDPADDRFKMWYMGGMLHATGYAESIDGVHWTKPKLDIVDGTNITQQGNRDANVVWLDHSAPPHARYKMFRFQKVPKRGLCVHESPDGIHWGEPITWAGPCADRSTVFRNPFRDRWVFSIKGFENLNGVPQRVRRYWETPTLDTEYWQDDKDLGYWVGGTDHLPRQDNGLPPQIYNLDAVPYESLMLGLFTVLQAPPDKATGRQKINQIALGFSRDGFHWTHADDQPFIGVDERPGNWRWANIQSAGGGCVVVRDRLFFYFSARSLDPTDQEPDPTFAHGSTGLATLRRDGFASLEAGANIETLTTVPIRFNATRLFFNADCAGGRLVAEWLDEDGNIIEPFSAERCTPMSIDSTCHMMTWQNHEGFADIQDRPVRLRIHLLNGSLYSFWTSNSPHGESDGYVAGGGPGYDSDRDQI